MLLLLLLSLSMLLLFMFLQRCHNYAAVAAALLHVEAAWCSFFPRRVHRSHASTLLSSQTLARVRERELHELSNTGLHEATRRRARLYSLALMFCNHKNKKSLTPSIPCSFEKISQRNAVKPLWRAQKCKRNLRR